MFGFVNATMNAGVNAFRWGVSPLNTTPPVYIIAGAVLAWKGLEKLNSLRNEKTRDWLLQRATHNLLQIPYFKMILQKKLDEQFLDSAKSIQKKWEVFGKAITKIPKTGVSELKLIALIHKFHQITTLGLKGRHYSGTIYSNSLNNDPEIFKASNVEPIIALNEQLNRLFTVASHYSHLWNPLHTNEFPIGSFLEYQVVQMVARSFGGLKKNTAGVVTSGGTESLMMAAKAYRNWGLERGILPGEGVIIAPDSIHASLQKAADDYHIRLVLIPTDEEGQVDMEQLKKAVEQHKKNLVALFASAPSYPKGKIDPIGEIGNLASEYEVGFHVDCCLGGFIINFHPRYRSNFLEWPGVTSLSADTHKNGLAPKGSSVLVTQMMPDGKNLAYHSIYAIPEWTGGIYGTVKSAGSQSCTPVLQAFLAMLAVGKDGYEDIARSIVDTATGMADIIKKIPGLKLLGDPDLNVVAFKVDPKLGLMPGASYAFAKEMADRKFVLNALRNDSVHFCITDRFVEDPEALKKFETAAKESLEAVQDLNAKLVRQKKQFPGDAGLYCQLEASMNPNRQEQGWTKYVENKLFGTQGVHAAVKTYLLATLNPWLKRAKA